MTLVDIREFYEDRASGELKPGKKGISLQAAQWEVSFDEDMMRFGMSREGMDKYETMHYVKLLLPRVLSHSF
ncbi:unnamed protein product [Choristocarpus tenellus]